MRQDGQPTASASASSGGIGLSGLLTVLFVGLKLTGHIDWDWLWVLSPIWISLALAAVLLLITLLVFVWVESRR